MTSRYREMRACSARSSPLNDPELGPKLVELHRFARLHPVRHPSCIDRSSEGIEPRTRGAVADRLDGFESRPHRRTSASCSGLNTERPRLRRWREIEPGRGSVGCGPEALGRLGERLAGPEQGPCRAQWEQRLASARWFRLVARSARRPP